MSFSSFIVLSANTVKPTYSWDDGVPKLSASDSMVLSGSTYIGYAPYARLVLANTTNVSAISSIDSNFIYLWNFGDYYNNVNNLSAVSHLSNMSHVYVMPGLYTVSLGTRHFYLQQLQVDAGTDISCAGRYGIIWNWDNLIENSATPITYDETSLLGTKPKTWDDELKCRSKYCVNWTWQYLLSTASHPSFSQYNNSITWAQTKSGQIYEKRWIFEPSTTICDTKTIFQSMSSNLDSFTQVGLVRVLEIPPIAYLSASFVGHPHVAPLTATFTAEHSIAGSFPIERIYWKLDDDSDIVVVSRTGGVHNKDSRFVHVSCLSADLLDPRNYRPTVVYSKKYNGRTTFYPSISVEASSTSTIDCVSLLVGPLTADSTAHQEDVFALDAFASSSSSNKLLILQSGSHVTFVNT